MRGVSEIENRYKIYRLQEGTNQGMAQPDFHRIMVLMPGPLGGREFSYFGLSLFHDKCDWKEALEQEIEEEKKRIVEEMKRIVEEMKRVERLRKERISIAAVRRLTLDPVQDEFSRLPDRHRRTTLWLIHLGVTRNFPTPSDRSPSYQAVLTGRDTQYNWINIPDIAWMLIVQFWVVATLHYGTEMKIKARKEKREQASQERLKFHREKMAWKKLNPCSCGFDMYFDHYMEDCSTICLKQRSIVPPHLLRQGRSTEFTTSERINLLIESTDGKENSDLEVGVLARTDISMRSKISTFIPIHIGIFIHRQSPNHQYPFP